VTAESHASAIDQHADDAREPRPERRSQEIQRPSDAPGRSSIGVLGERTVWVDCDDPADGGNGPRLTAASSRWPTRSPACPSCSCRPRSRLRGAISVGVVHGQAVLDLNYVEGSSAEVDMNVVMTGVRRGAGQPSRCPSAAPGSTRSWRSPRGASVAWSRSSAAPSKRVPSASSPSRPVLVLATLNPAKGRELIALLGTVPFEIRMLADISGARLPEETGATYAENALVKARVAAELTGAVALGDDSGLEVDALDGAPGVRSARFAGEDATEPQRGVAADRLDGETGRVDRALPRVIALAGGGRPERKRRASPTA
jgi:hypothetical protein